MKSVIHTGGDYVKKWKVYTRTNVIFKLCDTTTDFVVVAWCNRIILAKRDATMCPNSWSPLHLVENGVDFVCRWFFIFFPLSHASAKSTRSHVIQVEIRCRRKFMLFESDAVSFIDAAAILSHGSHTSLVDTSVLTDLRSELVCSFLNIINLLFTSPFPTCWTPENTDTYERDNVHYSIGRLRRTDVCREYSNSNTTTTATIDKNTTRNV